MKDSNDGEEDHNFSKTENMKIYLTNLIKEELDEIENEYNKVEENTNSLDKIENQEENQEENQVPNNENNESNNEESESTNIDKLSNDVERAREKDLSNESQIISSEYMNQLKNHFEEIKGMVFKLQKVELPNEFLEINSKLSESINYFQENTKNLKEVIDKQDLKIEEQVKNDVSNALKEAINENKIETKLSQKTEKLITFSSIINISFALLILVISIFGFQVYSDHIKYQNIIKVISNLPEEKQVAIKKILTDGFIDKQ